MLRTYPAQPAPRRARFALRAATFVMAAGASFRTFCAFAGEEQL